MPGAGPAPKHPSTRARRNATFAMTQLSAKGRTGRAPKWPFSADISMAVHKRMADEAAAAARVELEDPETPTRSLPRIKRELAKAIKDGNVLQAQIIQTRKLEAELWTTLWKTPQAIQWEKLSWDREVAQYVRWKIRAEMGDLDASKEARMLSDRLGLSPLALLRLRWEIVEDAPTSGSKATRRPRKKAGADPRAALYAVK